MAHPSEFIELPNGVNLHVRDEGDPNLLQSYFSSWAY